MNNYIKLTTPKKLSPTKILKRIVLTILAFLLFCYVLIHAAGPSSLSYIIEKTKSSYVCRVFLERYPDKITLAENYKRILKENGGKNNLKSIEKHNDYIRTKAKEKSEKEYYDKYHNNSLRTGEQPYANWYGENYKTEKWGFSRIEVKASSEGDVIAMIKSLDGKVIGHVYVKEMETGSISVPNGKYHIFFYSGKGWDPNKRKQHVIGGFITKESITKDDKVIELDNNILTYTLTAVKNGNFRTSISNEEEAF